MKITADGTVKVLALDFGLAKAIEGNANEPDASLTTAAGTDAGGVLGTAA